MKQAVVFLGGNGHCAARLEGARRVLALQTGGQPFALQEIHYPGFEGRPQAKTWPDFLQSVQAEIQIARQHMEDAVLYATGIGGLLLLCLRARGDLTEVPIIMQGPVLWGLEKRLMPRLMRLGPMRQMLPLLFGNSLFQRRFLRKYFLRPISPESAEAFFAGYASCAALPDFFDWMTPALLRVLEDDLRDCPERLARIEIWWGGEDKVVTLQELRWTEQALGTNFPLQVFPEWGHYPMIDSPEAWVGALTDWWKNKHV
jgi:pimeloyl-ACP methyl ester carboxylesterase